MADRTRILNFVTALNRIDETLDAHEGVKKSAWKHQHWSEHIRRAIRHFANALVGAGDGSEIELSHGAMRAIMAVETFIREHPEQRILCASHAKPQYISKAGEASLAAEMARTLAKMERQAFHPILGWQ